MGYNDACMMETIKEKVVVEGVHDASTLKRYFNVDCIITHGSAIDETILEYIGKWIIDPGVIVFTDPDAPGEKIRQTIMQRYPMVKHAYIDKRKARTDKKVGVEHADHDAIKYALDHVASYDHHSTHGLTMNDMIALKLSGDPSSAHRRMILSQHYPIGHTNAKTCLKRLNYLHITKEELESIDYGKDRNL